MRQRRSALALFIASALLVPVAAAEPKKSERAAQPAKAATYADILVLHATNAKKGVDARLRELPELMKPPFSSYDSYQVVDHAKLPLAPGSANTLRLPNGRVFQTQLLEVLRDDFVRLSASINQPGGADFLPLLAVKAKIGQRFIVAGQSYKSGILVLVIRVTK